MRRTDERGFTLVEMLVGLLVTTLIALGLATVMIHKSRINKAQQMYAEVQLNARSSMELIVARLRSAGWDPINADIETVRPDPDLSDDVSQLEIIADLDEDGLTDSLDEEVLIRHVGDQVEWRRTSGGSFTIVAVDITNDADVDGIVEPMFQLDDPVSPGVITVQVTAQSPDPDPRNGEFIRYTLRNEVVLRNQL